ncbi:DUF2752 domain-containing protein [Nocardioides sp.]|uniref:DUF2752 domain-containing protein n=1 Tax=Nocardioides sp. TaxID=35761 RepID=UPI00239544DE|nr:DUF2752 domain-containing protein [Nocardioides sp.]MDE0775454.1 DUF2752 domain-containing protein [Nocardioides sp.]
MSQDLVEAPPQETARGRRMLAPLATIGGLGLATLALHLRDPHESGSWGLCPSAALGFWCPGCGGLRGVNDLTDLRVVDAASSNLVLVLAMPVMIFLLGRWAFDSWSGRVRTPMDHRVNAVLLTLSLTALAAFTVLRNLPAGSWLAP